MSKIQGTKLTDQLNSLLEYFGLLKDRSQNHENIADIIHSSFKLIHNIKSNLFLMDHNKSLKMTYYMESYFEKLRIGNSKIIIKILQLFEMSIEWIKDDVDNNIADVSQYKDLIRELKNMKLTALENHERNDKINLSSDEKALLRDARNSGLNIFFVEEEISVNIDKNEYRNLPLVKLVNKVGMIVLQTPAYNNINKNNSDKSVVIKILFVTDKNQKELNDPLFHSLSTFEEDLFLNTKDYKILIIEDNPVALLLQRSIMSSFGVCDTVNEGSSGLDLFKLALAENAPYNIILLDLVMPGIGGSEVLRNIRAIEENEGIKGLDRSKVIVSTTNNDSSTLMDLFRAETDAYIVKPLTKEKIEKELANLKLM